MFKSPNSPKIRPENNRFSNRIVTFTRFGLIALGLGIAAGQFIENEAHAQAVTQAPIAATSTADDDGDGILNVNDNCRLVPNPDQGNADSDSHGDKCDNCPHKKNSALPGKKQLDTDGDGDGDECDEDDDNDKKLDVDEDINGNGIVDPGETDPKKADTDGDGLNDNVDPEPLKSRGTAVDGSGNPLDTDGDGIRNDVDEDDDGDGMQDIWETIPGYNFDPLDATDASEDPDDDKYTNLEEHNGLSNPRSKDSIPNRFNVSKTTDPRDSRNHKPGNNHFSFIPADEELWQTLPLWPCDDVRKKDRHRKTKLDLPSPSVVFQSIKQLQGENGSVTSRTRTFASNLGGLNEIKAELTKLSPAGNPYPKGSDEWNRVNNEYLELLQIYNNETAANNQVIGNWRTLSGKFGILRGTIKDIIAKELRVGRRAKRCYKGWVDFNYPDDLAISPLIVLAPSTTATGFNDYTKQQQLGNILNLQGLMCATISHEDVKNDALTNSKVLEQLKFLEKVVFQHMEAAQRRAIIYIQMANLAKKLRREKKKAEARPYEKIVRNGQSRNNEVLRLWKNVYVKIVGQHSDPETGQREIISLKQEVVEAENTTTTEFDVIDRCISK